MRTLLVAAVFTVLAPLAKADHNHDHDAQAALALAAAAHKKPATPVPVPAPLPPSPVIVTEPSFSGHTHTCANGHTWDHTMDGGSHRCPTCGLSQFIVDQPGAFRGSPRQFYTIGSGSGCANGNCPTYSQPTYGRGIFGRR